MFKPQYQPSLSYNILLDDEIIIRQYREKNDIDNETQLYLQVTSTSFYFYDAGEDGK